MNELAPGFPFPAPLAVLDLETTGGDPTRDRITEIGIVRIAPDGRQDEWSSLVDPGQPIPIEIQRLTGISNEMVRDAPPFEAIARQLAQHLDGHLLVAHNARFDHGFLRNAFARAGLAFTTDVLCTVRLSRRLDPGESGHGLDALMARWGVAGETRHRALGDARAVVRLIEAWRARHGDATIAAVARALLRVPSLPPHLPPDALDGLPDAPGVYVFHGINDLPIYIGKSIELRPRVRSHFSADWRNGNDARLSAEVRRIEWTLCAGELGALLLESDWIKRRFPLLNRAQRANRAACVIRLPRARAEGGPVDASLSPAPEVVPVDPIEPRALPGHHGPFKDRRAARAMLQKLAAEHGLCWSRLGLEKRDGPCFGRQVRKCRGACVGAEDGATHDQRLAEALVSWRIPPWPFDGEVTIVERAVDGTVHRHRVDHWRHIATDRGEPAPATSPAAHAPPGSPGPASSEVAEPAAQAAARASPNRLRDRQVPFEADVYRLLRRWVDNGCAGLETPGEAGDCSLPSDAGHDGQSGDPGRAAG